MSVHQSFFRIIFVLLSMAFLSPTLAHANVTPDTPSNLGPTSVVDGTATSTTQPRLNFTITDPDAGDNLRYQIQIDDTADFSSPIVDYSFPGGVQGSRSFPVGQSGGSGASYAAGFTGQTLADGSYYWRVRSSDDSYATSTYATANGGAVAFKIDTTAPVLSVSGTNPITIDADSTYTDAGATANDAIAGNLTSSVVTSGTVNTHAEGTYTITYTVVDGAGNSTSATRTVTVRATGGSMAWCLGPLAPGWNNSLPDGGCSHNSTAATPASTSFVGASSTSTFTKDLSKGLTDTDVVLLQHFLNTHSFIVADTGTGSIGQESNYFGSKTAAALAQFQKKYALPATGYFGPMTRAFIFKHF